MFTVKYRYWMPAPDPKAEQSDAAGPAIIPGSYVSHEQIWGPYEFVTKETCMKTGLPVVYCHQQLAVDAEHGKLPMTFGPITAGGETPDAQPRPTLWVMNEHGATVAKYDL